VEKPLSSAKIEIQRTESISGSLRPHLSAALPAITPPTSRMISVIVPSAPASTASIENAFSMSTRMNVMAEKSKPSNIHPMNVPAKARH
jgi:hypothetical protein